ncbi:SsrA-binding protein [Brucella abortus]|nr:SsrA-binding protein [Brucella abortus]
MAAKLELALPRGKKTHDKRETEKKRDWNREKRVCCATGDDSKRIPKSAKRFSDKMRARKDLHPEKCEAPTQGNQSTGLISDPASIR